MKHAEHSFIVRVPALPADVLDTVSADAASILGRHAQAESELATQADVCSDRLHVLIGSIDHGRERGTLLALRRAIHNGKVPKVARLLAGVVHLLSAGLKDDIARWQAKHGRLGVIAGESARAWDLDAENTAAEVVAIARRPPISAELERAESPLADVLGKADAHRDLDAVLSLHAFVARASVKTTPRGTLCSWAHGTFDDGPDRWQGDIADRVVHVELNATINEVMLRHLVRADRWRTNPAAAVSADSTYYVRGDHRILGMVRPGATVACLLAAWRTREITEAAAVAEVVRALGCEPEQAERVLRRLIEAELLVPALTTVPQGRTGVSAALRHVDRTSQTFELLTSVADATTAMAAQRAPVAVREVTRSLARLGRHLGWVSEALDRGVTAFSDTVARNGSLALDHRWAGTATTLRDIGRWAAHTDPWDDARRLAAQHLAEQYGEETPIAAVEALHVLVASGQDGLTALWDDSFLMPTDSIASLRSLRQLLAESPVVDGEIVIDRLPPAPLGGSSLTTSLAFYGHPVQRAGQRLFVINSIEDGCGRPDVYVRRLLDRLGVPGPESAEWPRSGPTSAADKLDVEITMAAGSNVNLRALGDLTELVIASSPVVTPNITLSDCDVVVSKGRVLLTHDGRPMRIVPRGRMADFRYPPVPRMLLRLFGPPAEHRIQPAVAPGVATANGTIIAPRVRIGDVVLLRRTIIVEMDDIPRRQAGERAFDFATRLVAWCERLDVPTKSYVRHIEHVSTGKGRKPIPLDLRTPLGVALFDKLTRRGGRRVLFHEVLPSAADVPTDRTGVPWIPEVAWEVDLHD